MSEVEEVTVILQAGNLDIAVEGIAEISRDILDLGQNIAAEFVEIARRISRFFPILNNLGVMMGIDPRQIHTIFDKGMEILKAVFSPGTVPAPIRDAYIDIMEKNSIRVNQITNLEHLQDFIQFFGDTYRDSKGPIQFLLSFTGIGYVFPLIDIGLAAKKVRESGGKEGKFDLSVTVMVAAAPSQVAKPLRRQLARLLKGKKNFSRFTVNSDRHDHLSGRYRQAMGIAMRRSLRSVKEPIKLDRIRERKIQYRNQLGVTGMLINPVDKLIGLPIEEFIKKMVDISGDMIRFRDPRYPT